MSGREFRTLGLLLAIFAAVAIANIGWDAHVGRLPSWDQAHHLTIALSYANSVRHFRLFHQYLFVPENYAPGFHLLMSLVMLVAGPISSAGLWANLLAAPVLIFCTWRIGARLFDSETGLGAAALVCLYPAIAVFAREAMIEYSLTAVTTAAILAALRTEDFDHRRESIILGAVLGLGLLFKPTFALCLWLPVLVLAASALLRDRRRAANVALCASVALFVAASWYWPQRAGIAQLARVNHADAVRWGHDATPGGTFLYYAGRLTSELTTALGALIALAGLAWAARSGRERHRWILHAWIAGAWALLVLVIRYHDPKYLLPTLPAMAIAGVAWIRTAPAGWPRSTLLAAIGAYHLAVASCVLFAFPPIPVPIFVVGGVQLYPLRTESQYDYMGGDEPWPNGAIVHAIATAGRQHSFRPTRAGIVPDLLHFNCNTLTWEARREGFDWLDFPLLGDPGRTHDTRARDLRRLDFVILKSGDFSEFSDEIHSDPSSFALAGRFATPDGDAVELYRVTSPSIRITLPGEAVRLVANGKAAVAGARFGDRIELIGASLEDVPGGRLLRLAWRALTEHALDRLVGVHFIGRLSRESADYPQDARETTVVPGEEWVDEVFLDAGRLSGATAIGLGLYTGADGRDRLPIDRGPRDWQGTRLIVPLRDEIPR